MKFYCEDSEKVLQEVGSTKEGLSSAEASKRLEQNGKNKLAAAKGKSLIRRFLEQLADPMIIILLVAAAISGVLAVAEGEGLADVIIILAVVIVNAVLGVYQESKAEKAIEALQEMSAATSKVLRDGKVQIVHSEDLVVGDVILLEAGDAVPADARILENASLKVEEAALTGESVPVTKFIDIINLKEGEKDVPLGDRKNMLYMGSTVVYGRGTAVVTATGMDTEMGKIAGALQQAEEGDTPLQRKLNQLSKILTWLVLGICIAVFGVQLLRAGNFSFNDTILPSFTLSRRPQRDDERFPQPVMSHSFAQSRQLIREHVARPDESGIAHISRTAPGLAINTFRVNVKSDAIKARLIDELCMAQLGTPTT